MRSEGGRMARKSNSHLSRDFRNRTEAVSPRMRSVGSGLYVKIEAVLKENLLRGFHASASLSCHRSGNWCSPTVGLHREFCLFPFRQRRDSSSSASRPGAGAVGPRRFRCENLKSSGRSRFEVLLGGNAEQLIDELDLGNRVSLCDPPRSPLPDHVHRFDPSQCPPGGRD